MYPAAQRERTSNCKELSLLLLQETGGKEGGALSTTSWQKGSSTCGCSQNSWDLQPSVLGSVSILFTVLGEGGAASRPLLVGLLSIPPLPYLSEEKDTPHQQGFQSLCPTKQRATCTYPCVTAPLKTRITCMFPFIPHSPHPSSPFLTSYSKLLSKKGHTVQLRCRAHVSHTKALGSIPSTKIPTAQKKRGHVSTLEEATEEIVTSRTLSLLSTKVGFSHINLPSFIFSLGQLQRKTLPRRHLLHQSRQSKQHGQQSKKERDKVQGSPQQC